MGFFDAFPRPSVAQRPVAPPRWLEPPDDELPASVGVDLVLAVGAKAAVYIARPACHAEGMVFDLVVVGRDATRDEAHAMHHLTGAGPGGGAVPDELLRFGVVYDDGRRASNLGGGPPPQKPPPVSLTARGGGGRPGHWREQWWLWPLPDTGDLTFVCEWPAHALAESHATMDGGPLRAAAARARPLWS